MEDFNTQNTTVVRTPKELGEAIKSEQDRITIEGSLADKTIRIHATGKVAWAVAFGSIGLAAYSIISAPAATVATAPAGGAGGVISFTGSAVGTGTAVTVLGTATYAAIAIAVAAGGVGVLTTLRNKYKIESKEKGKVVLKRKK